MSRLLLQQGWGVRVWCGGVWWGVGRGCHQSLCLCFSTVSLQSSILLQKKLPCLLQSVGASTDHGVPRGSLATGVSGDSRDHGEVHSGANSIKPSIEPSSAPWCQPFGCSNLSQSRERNLRNPKELLVIKAFWWQGSHHHCSTQLAPPQVSFNNTESFFLLTISHGAVWEMNVSHVPKMGLVSGRWEECFDF